LHLTTFRERPANTAGTRECFNSIPKQLAKENKKFQWSKVKPGGRGETYMGSIQWLEDAGIICRCYNTDITSLPMEGNAKDNVFKVYTADIADGLRG